MTDQSSDKTLVDIAITGGMGALVAAIFAAIRAAVDVPILANMTEFGKSELFSVDQLANVGVNIVIWPVSLLRMAMGSAERALDTIIGEGHLTGQLDQMQHRADLYDLIDYEDYNSFDSGVFNFTITKE